MIAYLDTNILLWLSENNQKKISRRALDTLNRLDLRVSPMVKIELTYLHEVGRTSRAAQDILRQLQSQIGLEVCDHSFADVADIATYETWTRDPFDRVIVAQAKANKYSPLVTADEKIRANYPKSIW